MQPGGSLTFLFPASLLRAKQVALTLAPEKREQLLQRLAQGARNAELARDFGLSMRQVQGIRMGSAREIARRRNGALEKARRSRNTTSAGASLRLRLEAPGRARKANGSAVAHQGTGPARFRHHHSEQ